MKAKLIILTEKHQGAAKESDFLLIEEHLPPLEDGEFLVEAEYISVDPYMRLYPSPVSKIVTAEQVGKILQSKNDNFPPGRYVIGEFGWRTHTVASAKTKTFSPLTPRLLPDYGNNLPRSLALGMLGMTGNTALFCLMDKCRAHRGDTVVVSGAGGAVGSHAGQIAKIKGCWVIGITDTDEKGDWIVEELGFDGYINCNWPFFSERLMELTPRGINCYFDGVGGKISELVLRKMSNYKAGRIGVCGTIADYNDDDDTGLKTESPMDINFNVFQCARKWNDGIRQNLQWLKEGKLKYRETITEGFENTPKAFVEMMNGANIGKAIVKV